MNPHAATGLPRLGRFLRPVLTALLGLLAVADARAQSRPVIRGIGRDAEGRMVLTIRPAGVAGEVLDVFFADSLTAPRWRLAGAYVRPAAGAGEVMWVDANVTNAAAPAGIYVVGRADVDLDEDGIPDAREGLYHVHDLPAGVRARWARAGLRKPAPEYTNVLNAKNYGVKGDGVTDDGPALNTLISQAPARSVIRLPAGTYRILQPLYLKSEVVLRGDGALLTSLLFSGAGTAGRCIGMLRWDSQQTTTYVTMTGGMEWGSTNVTVSGVTGFQAGDLVEMEEDNDPAWGLTESWQTRLPGQINRVVAVDAAAKRLVLDRPLRHTFTAARNPKLRKLNMVVGAGVENLYVRRVDAVDGHTIEMKYAANCWVRGVQSYKTYKHHVTMERSFECEVRQNYFHDSHVFAGGQGYGAACTRHTSDCLIEDNIFRHLRHSMSVGIGASGNVYGYNFSTVRALDPSLGTPQADISVHGCYVFMNLFEGNVLEDADVPDWYWPAGPGNTLFRNRILNTGTAIDVGSNSQNFMGNVLPQGVVTKSASVQTFVDYGNECKGVATWPGCPCRNLPDSLYRAVPPDFFPAGGAFAWPPIGPGMTPAAACIPAQQRYTSGQYVP